MAKRSRTERRESARRAEKLVRARTKLAAMETGGAPDRPIEVPSASVVEPHAAGLPCAACAERGVRVEEHAAVSIVDAAGHPRALRVVRLFCPRCHHRRELFFRIGTTLAS